MSTTRGQMKTSKKINLSHNKTILKKRRKQIWKTTD